MSIGILLTEIIKWKTSSEKNYKLQWQYHHYKLDIRKPEIVFNIFLQKLIGANYLIEVKKRINKEQMQNLQQILMKIKYFPKILPQLDDLSAEGNHVGEKSIKSQIISQKTHNEVATMYMHYAAYSTRSFSLVWMMQIISTCYSVHQVSRHWQNQCSQTVSTHQTLGSSDLQGDILSMMQTLLLATSVSTIPVIECQRNKVKTYTQT